MHGIEVDLHWPQEGLVIEVDGPGHRRPRTRDEDATREAALIENGYEVVRVKSF